VKVQYAKVRAGGRCYVDVGNRATAGKLSMRHLEESTLRTPAPWIRTNVQEHVAAKQEEEEEPRHTP